MEENLFVMYSGVDLNNEIALFIVQISLRQGSALTQLICLLTFGSGYVLLCVGGHLLLHAF